MSTRYPAPPNMDFCPSGLHWVASGSLILRSNADGTPARTSCTHCARTCATRARACRLATIRAVVGRVKSNLKGERVS